MARIAYYRVSTRDQTIESQRSAISCGIAFDKEFIDEGVSGAVLAAARPGFSELLKYTREGDTLFVSAVDRLGRDALDVQATVRNLIGRGVSVHVHGLGLISKGVGELILAVLAQVASLERDRIAERTAAGRATARSTLDATGKTHRGKTSMGRPFGANPGEVAQWRRVNGASMSQTAAQFGLSLSTVKRYCSIKGQALADCVAANLTRMTDSDSSMNALLTKLEGDVPSRSDFGPFRGRRG
ncbi:recombinase family protein [Roseateles koreensis]|uniref:Recombinase family protein n=1 Tax=Roseateles koreensis TaxID=2987526 RepID=A0ABT5KVY9_9BURK|nr:recombinase family protein [Roseateles koreensis]MDC8787106.1 recombinase family protein [Roseateles koreensis]